MKQISIHAARVGMQAYEGKITHIDASFDGRGEKRVIFRQPSGVNLSLPFKASSNLLIKEIK